MQNSTVRRRLISVTVKWTFAAICYYLAPKLAFIPPIRIQPIWIDRLIPYISWSVPIYLSLYFQVMFCLLTTKNLFELDSLLKSYLWMTCILASFYMAIPIQGWVEPLPNHNLWDSVMNWIRTVDMPSNSLPSGHVAYSLMGPFFFFAYGEEGDRRKWFFLFWGILISLSTMTTKQHLIGDVFCGTILALAFGFVWGLYARERVFLRMKGKKLKLREKWRRKRARRRLAHQEKFQKKD